MKVYNSIDELIGNTPLFKANNIEKEEKLLGNLYLKLEYFNPAGSVKDRVALSMLCDAEERGIITKGATIIEPTSGNTGIGLAAISASRGYKAILIMPDTMSKERILLLKAYGAEVILTDGKLGMKGCIDKAKEIDEKTPNSLIAGQFENPSNPKAHYNTTAKEIYRDLDGKVDVFIAGVGSGGTITGTGKYLKEVNKDTEVVAVEPADSPLISKGVSGSHNIQGIGANFIPKNYDSSVVDRVETVTTEDSYKYARMLAKREGILTGISSGAAISVAVKLLKQEKYKGKNIVVILPDTGDRYLSTGLYSE